MSKANRTRGFTLVEIMIVILIIGILVSIAVPTFMRVRSSSRRSSCMSNLRSIDSRKEQLAMQDKLEDGDTVTWAQLVPLYIKTQPQCPGGGTYDIGVVGATPTCTESANGHVLP